MCIGGVLVFFLGPVLGYLSLFLGLRAVLGACFRLLLSMQFRFLANIDFWQMYCAFCYVSWVHGVLILTAKCNACRACIRMLPSFWFLLLCTTLAGFWRSYMWVLAACSTLDFGTRFSPGVLLDVRHLLFFSPTSRRIKWRVQFSGFCGILSSARGLFCRFGAVYTSHLTCVS